MVAIEDHGFEPPILPPIPRNAQADLITWEALTDLRRQGFRIVTLADLEEYRHVLRSIRKDGHFIFVDEKYGRSKMVMKDGRVWDIEREDGEVALVLPPEALTNLHLHIDPVTEAGARQANRSFLCNAEGCTNAGYSHCGRCKTTRYCSKACQRAHWRKHKKGCVPPAVEVPLLGEFRVARVPDEYPYMMIVLSDFGDKSFLPLRDVDGNVILLDSNDRDLEAIKIMQLSDYPHKGIASADGYLSLTPGVPLLHASPVKEEMMKMMEEEKGDRFKVYHRAEDVPGPVGFD